MIKFIPVFVKRTRFVGKSFHYTLFARNAPRAWVHSVGTRSY
jgi:hypothetical protein